MGVIGVILGAMVGVGLDAFSNQYLGNILIGCVIVYFFMAAGNMLNDYFDRDLDLINHPERPIPSGKLRAKDVLISAVVIFGLILVLGVLVNIFMVMILIIAMILMLGYEVTLKNSGLVGNISISILVAMLFLFGAAAVSEFGVVIFLSLLAFLATLTREIVKDIQDIKGDQDRNTLPKAIGIKNASYIASIVLVLAVLLSPLPIYPELIPLLEFDRLNMWYIYLILPSDALFIFSMIYFRSRPNLASQALKGGMFVALVAFLVGSI
jgi:geranylgeranylglycerol-phosphate geranylgeranyltransferase